MKRSDFIALMCAPLIAPFVKAEEPKEMTAYIQTEDGYTVARVMGNNLENVTVFDYPLTDHEARQLYDEARNKQSKQMLDFVRSR